MCPELKLEKIIQLWSFFVKLWGLKFAVLANLRKLTSDLFRAITRKRRFNPT